MSECFAFQWRTALERLEFRSDVVMGSPAFPFIDQGRGLGYTREKERKEKKKEKNRGEEGSKAVFLFSPYRWAPLGL